MSLFRMLFGFSLLIALAGCGAESTTDTPSGPSLSESGQFELHVIDADWSPTVGKTSLRLYLTNADGYVVASDLTMEPWMPDHGHGSPDVPVCTNAGEGSWEITELVFSMPGRWELRVAGTIDGAAERFVVPVDVQ